MPQRALLRPLPCLQGIPRRGADGKLLGRAVVHSPSGHKAVPDGMTIDAGGFALLLRQHVPICLACRRALQQLLPPQPVGAASCSSRVLHPAACVFDSADGNLWVAIGESGSVVCYSAATGGAQVQAAS